MAVEGLAIIGEAINDSVPSTRKLFDAADIEGLVELARFQDRRGAACIDLNIGSRPAELMAELVARVQAASSKPLAIDTPDLQIAEAGLRAYDPQQAGGRKPILNSVTLLRVEMFGLARLQPLRPILLASEHVLGGRPRPCRTAQETCQAAKDLVTLFRSHCPDAANDDCIIDPGVVPIASDSEGHLHRLIAALELIRDDPELAGVHISVGLSNFTVMLPPRRADGSPLRSPLESALLTKAMPLGLDMIIGSVKRNYRLLPPDHPAVVCLEDCLRLEGFDVIVRVQEFYR
jgi:5-methyltetrahydrofolate corrinoid/iron sulfur protein methyltransferase